MFTWFIRFLAPLCDLSVTPRVIKPVTTPQKLNPNLPLSIITCEAAVPRKSNVLTTLHTRPLRIIHWVETGGKSAHPARRMVISGRFADVCAEIDRLAALEST